MILQEIAHLRGAMRASGSDRLNAFELDIGSVSPPDGRFNVFRQRKAKRCEIPQVTESFALLIDGLYVARDLSHLFWISRLHRLFDSSQILIDLGLMIYHYLLFTDGFQRCWRVKPSEIVWSNILNGKKKMNWFYSEMVVENG